MQSIDEIYESIVSSYDTSNPKIVLKIKHMIEVSKISNDIASSLKLSKEDTRLATLIGYLHDVGRLYQIEKYNSYDDSKTIDHASASIYMLFSLNLIEKFDVSKEEYRVIEKAIFNHNKIEIEKGLNERELLFTKIIRDADKIDIFRAMSSVSIKDGFFDENIGNYTFSPGMIELFYEQKLIHNTLRNNPLDDYVAKMAYIFDLNFDISKEILLKLGYLELFTEEFLKKTNIKDKYVIEKIDEILRFSLNYLKK